MQLLRIAQLPNLRFGFRQVGGWLWLRPQAALRLCGLCVEMNKSLF